MEFSGGYGNSGSVFGFGDIQVFLVNVYEFEVIFVDVVVFVVFEDEVQDIGSVFGFEGQDVFVLGGVENFGEGGEVDIECDVVVVLVGGEVFGFEYYGDEGNVGVVYSLQCDIGVIVVEVVVLNEVFDGIDNLYMRRLVSGKNGMQQGLGLE